MYLELGLIEGRAWRWKEIFVTSLLARVLRCRREAELEGKKAFLLSSYVLPASQGI
jgi:hypothetical protein